MAKPLVTDELWEVIGPLLPPVPPKPKGGRPRLDDHAALTGVLFVLKTGIPWEMLPQEMGCGSGMICWRRLKEWREAGGCGIDSERRFWSASARRTRSTGSGRLWTRRACPPPGGQKTGPNPTDKGKSGSKRHVVVDRNGIPLAVIHTAANVHDSKALEEAVDAVSPIRKPLGRPRKRPKKLHADKGYDFPRCRKALRKRSITPRIARRGVESSERLGGHRWVVERTLSWLNRYRRPKVRYERRADIHQEAFLELGCALICWRYVQRFC